MKFPLAVLAVFVALSVRSQTTAWQDSMDSQIDRFVNERPSQSLFGVQQEQANEIKRDGVSYSGIFVELAKTDQPFQLINPLAPAEYGSSEDNTARDPITGEVSGLKLFSIRF